MSQRCQIIIPSSGVVELFNDVDIALTYQIADIKEPQKRHADYSKTITVPGTHNNNKMFQHIFDIGIDRYFNPNKKAKALLTVDSTTVMNGFMRLRNIVKNDEKTEYQIELTGRLADLFTTIGDAKLKDLSWADLDHTYNRPNQIASWLTPIGHNYVYPFIDYGYTINEIDYHVEHFFPALYVREIWNRIFSYAGFQYYSASNFFDSTLFKSLIMPFNSDKMRLTNTQIEARRFRARRNTTNQSITVAIPTSSFTASDIIFNDDTSSGNQDTGGVYNTATGVFTCGASGHYTLSFNAVTRLNVNFSAGVAGSSVIVYTYFKLIDVTNGNNALQPISATANMAVSGASAGTVYSSTYSLSASTPNPVFIPAGTQLKVQVWRLYAQLGSPSVSSVAIEVLTDAGCYFSASADPTIKEGDTVTMVNCIDQEMKMKDFINSVIKMFNIYTEYDKDVPNKLLMQPRPYFYNTTIINDWTQKRDLSRDLEITPMGALQARKYLFTYKQDKDYYNEKYLSETGEVYGQRLLVVDNDFLVNTEKEEISFSPSPLDSTSAQALNIQPVSNNDRYFTKIIKVDPSGTVSTTTSNPRILYYGGVKPCKAWNYKSNTLATSGVTNYPYAGHLDNAITPTVDLNFGLPKIVYYIPDFSATYTDNNLYNAYWKQEIDEITDKNSSIVTGWFKLTPKDISIIDFSHIFRFDFQNFRLNKIYDYNPLSDGFTKCEFIKIKEGIPFVANTGILNGANDTLIGGIPMPNPKPRPKKGGNSTSSTTSTSSNRVSGIKNIIPLSAQRVFIHGDENSVGENADSINIINSSGCVVPGGLRNVTIINSSGVTVAESNVIYENNQQVNNATGGIRQVTASASANIGDKLVLASASAAVIEFTLPLASSSMGREISVKKIDSSANAVSVVRTGSDTIDGASSKSIGTQYESYTFKSNGSNWFII